MDLSWTNRRENERMYYVCEKTSRSFDKVLMRQIKGKRFMHIFYIISTHFEFVKAIVKTL